jgi:hypothetical protein
MVGVLRNIGVLGITVVLMKLIDLYCILAYV